MLRQTAAYGSWESPVSPDLIVAESVALGDIRLADGDGGVCTYWVESRPAESGRAVIMQSVAGRPLEEMTPAQYSALSRVHEYGGGAFTVHQGTIYFVNLKDQGIYRQKPGEPPQALRVQEGERFADLAIDAARRRLLCVCEAHGGAAEPSNTLVAIDLDSGRAMTLAQGADFYSSPVLNADGRRLAWLCWRHPNMPWDGTELWMAELDAAGEAVNPQRIAGGNDESVFQPQWGPDGGLYFVSDRSDWWNLYCYRAGLTRALIPMPAEFGLPQWLFAMSTYGFDDRGNLICAYRQDGVWRLGRLTGGGDFSTFELPFTSIEGVRCQGRRAVFHGGSPSQTTAIVELDLDSGALTTLRRSSHLDLNADYLSVPEAMAFPTSGGRTAHAFFYPPCNRDFRAPDGERPPLLVKGHGGPTASTVSTLNLAIQYWTSRGFAVLDVNYGGSTGYGRAYRRQLYGQWGVVDVDDCVAAAGAVIAQGRADGERCAIRGNSAGGYTSLAALAFRDLFRAGASYYGISDLEMLARDTHKFESRYLERLIGAYPEQRELYRRRSPIHYVDDLAVPVIFFQGLEDQVVPPNQAESMVEALRRKGVAVAYVPFAAERHGFRKAENIKRALEAELYFYSRVFGFTPHDDIEPVPIDNLA